jgi:putative endonuclease
VPAAGRISWHVYIVRCKDRTLYTGVAKDLPARIAAHNDGRGAKYTRPRLPVRLVYAEAAADRSAAQRREHEIKRLTRAAKRALCSQLMTEKRRPSGRMIAFKK